MGRRILITSGKGGTGKTTVTAAIASCLSALGRRVVCVDADSGLRNLDIVLGMTDSVVWDFGDVIAGRTSLESALGSCQGIPNLHLLAAPSEPGPDSISPEAFSSLTTILSERFDYCFVDSPAGLGAGFAMAVGACDYAIVVCLLEPTSLRDAARVVDILDKNGLHKTTLIVNRVRPKLLRKVKSANVDDAMDALGLPLLGLVPEDVHVLAASNRATPLILHDRKGASRAFLDIARRLDGQKIPITKHTKARY